MKDKLDEDDKKEDLLNQIQDVIYNLFSTIFSDQQNDFIIGYYENKVRES